MLFCDHASIQLADFLSIISVYQLDEHQVSTIYVQKPRVTLSLVYSDQTSSMATVLICPEASDLKITANSSGSLALRKCVGDAFTVNYIEMLHSGRFMGFGNNLKHKEYKQDGTN